MLVSYRATDIIARPFTGRYYRERQNVVIHEFRNASDPGFQSPFKTMMVGRLTVIEPDRDAYTVSVTDGQVLIVGRGPTADIVILDKLASRNHCELRNDGGKCTLSDLESLNGTYLNGAKLSSDSLKPGDKFSIGSTEFEFVTEEEEVLPPAEAILSSEIGTPSAPSPPPLPEPAIKESTNGSNDDSRPKPATVGSTIQATPTNLSPDALHPDHTVDLFLKKNMDMAANKVVTPFQVLWYMTVLAAAFVIFLYDWLHFLHLAHLFCSLYLVVILFKLACVGLSVLFRMDIRIKEDELASLKDEDLPIYTILVPLYKETEVAQKIVRNLKALDYPQEKLDVKLLLEEDDQETIQACLEADLPENFHTIVVADNKPKTKPKACNHGLEQAKGEYLVIYDAEDRPEPDQLKKAFYAFTERTGVRTVCLQAKLNYFNPRQNFLTKWFAIEYTTWFDLYLPGLHALRAPIPLGGTSNHFQTDVLRRIGGWDPFNVTEDCDLGIRLYRMGYKTAILDSTTWEEANSQLMNWIRQRSRWVKGYIQTHLVHMRNPVKTLWELGPWKFFGFLVSIGGLALTLLLNPIFWSVVIVYGGLWGAQLAAPGTEIYGVELAPWKMVYEINEYDQFWPKVSQVFFLMTAVLFAGNFFFVFTHIFACFRRGLLGLLFHALMMPIYWIFISIGAWKGFIQLLHNPFYWEKTQHGLDKGSDDHHSSDFNEED